MRNTVAAVSFLALVGCYSTSPLDPSPREGLDAALMGTWRCVTSDPRPFPRNKPEDWAGGATFSASTDRPGEYDLTMDDSGDSDEKKTETYRAFVSSARHARFLNVQPKKVEFGLAGWAFLRYSLPRPSLLYVEMVDEAPFKAKESSSTPAAARATLEKTLRDAPQLVKEYCVCVKVQAEVATK
jgi:hypothetical protein